MGNQADMLLRHLPLVDLYHFQTSSKVVCTAMTDSSCWLLAALAALPHVKMQFIDLQQEQRGGFPSLRLLRELRLAVPARHLELCLPRDSLAAQLARATKAAHLSGRNHKMLGGRVAVTLLARLHWQDRVALRMALDKDTPRTLCVSSPIELPAAESALMSAAVLAGPDLRLFFAVLQGDLLVAMVDGTFSVQ